MTDLSSSRLPPKGQALPHWDPLLRLAHWGIAVVVIANYAFTKEGGSVHIAFGWAGMALLLLRLIWGFVGPREARFTSFPPNPMAALRHLGGLLRGKAPHYPSHNPAGAMMAYALWACLAVLMLTGLGMRPQLAALPAPQHQRHLGQLRGLARTRFATHDDDLVRLHGSHDFLASGRDGQRFWKFNLEGNGRRQNRH